jgi:hypothetical protein
MFWFGMFFILISAMGMVIAHEFALSQIVFIMGIVIAGYAYAKSQESGTIAIDTKKIDKKIQTLNDLLWGKKE